MARKGKAGPWTTEEDGKLKEYIDAHRARDWETLARKLGLGKSGNSCRLRWLNYLSPNIRRGEFTEEEKRTILKLRHEGNGWSKIAKKLPGRTDNDIKNFCNSKRMKKELNSDVKKPIIADPAGGSGVTTVDVAASFSTGANHQVAAEAISTGASYQVTEDHGSDLESILNAHDSADTKDYWPAAAAEELMTDHGSILSFEDIEYLRELLGI